MGYHWAGFDIVGVDIRPQPNYPFEFAQGDVFGAGLLPFAIDYFDAIHASPPCQKHSVTRKIHSRRLRLFDIHADLIAPTRVLLEATGLPYVIENVEGAPLENPIRLCGSSFRDRLDLPLRRHRLFESNIPLTAPACDHTWQTEPRFPTHDRRGRGLTSVVLVSGHLDSIGDLERRRAAMGIDWMTNAELVEAIPPVYTEHIGRQLLAHLRAVAAA